VPVLAYVAQLVPPPPSLPQLERASLNKTLKLATSALHYPDYFQLAQFGGPSLRCAQATCWAALFRAARETVGCWRHWIPQLKAAAANTVSVSRLAQGLFYPDFWDSPPLAFNLLHAHNGSPVDPHWDSGIAQAVQSIDCPSGSRPSRAVGVQKVFYNHLVAHCSAQHNILDTLKDRAAVALALPLPNVLPSKEDLCKVTKGMRKHDIMKIFRTWTNSWSTSYRYKEAILLPCLFGCGLGVDSQKHYSHCPILFAILRCLRPSTPPCPKRRIGLLEPCTDTLLSLSCVYTGYHTLRRHGELYNCMHNSTHLRTLSTRVFGESFFAAACEVSLACRRPFPLLNSFPDLWGERLVHLCSLDVPSEAELIIFAERGLPDALLSVDFPLAGLSLSPGGPLSCYQRGVVLSQSLEIFDANLFDLQSDGEETVGGQSAGPKNPNRDPASLTFFDGRAHATN
jgi:hypothetical protein